ncbi:putative membrane protein [Paraburkholderia sp. BL23I1N1]|nr:putative membrane protein [Paraburkholderia sp. BL23I1N1]
MMSMLSPFGIFHTCVSLVALICGFASLFRSGYIRTQTGLGKAYAFTTAITATTGLFIFHHGGFGKPHVLSILTLVVLVVAAAAGSKFSTKPLSRYVETICYSATILFHFIPGITESGLRLPSGNPLFANPDVPALQMIDGALFVIFLACATVQCFALRGFRRRGATLE